jgi:hypothetical protein
MKVEMSGQNVTGLLFDDYLIGAYSIKVRPEDHVIFAIPPERLHEVARKSPELIKIAPHLLGLGQLRSVRFAALDLYFTEQLLLPKGHVTLMDDPQKLLAPQNREAKNGIASEYGLSFIDNGQFWPPDDWKKGQHGRHFLGVLVGDFASLSELDTTLDPDKLERQDNAPARIIADLQKYIYFTKDDIDWERSHFRSQKDTPLFVNSVGSWEYRPETRLSKDDRKGRTFAPLQEPPFNWYLAGDYCRSRIDVVSVEAALVTGITAARAICDRVEPALDPPTGDQEQIKRAKSLLSGWMEIAAAQARARANAARQGSA